MLNPEKHKRREKKFNQRFTIDIMENERIFKQDIDNFDICSVRRWTKSSIECYNRGCRCKGCIYTKILSSPCMMKKTVIELVKKFGKPPEEVNTVETITKEQIIELYIEKRLPLIRIYNILKIDKFEFLELLDKFEISTRKRPKVCGDNGEI